MLPAASRLPRPALSPFWRVKGSNSPHPTHTHQLFQTSWPPSNLLASLCNEELTQSLPWILVGGFETLGISSLRVSGLALAGPSLAAQGLASERQVSGLGPQGVNSSSAPGVGETRD